MRRLLSFVAGGRRRAGGCCRSRVRRSRSWRPPKTSPSLTKEVGGDKVSVEALARGYQDPHFVEAKPSFILKLQQRAAAGRRRTRAGDRLAAAAHHAEPQRGDPAGRPRVSRRVAERAHPRHPHRPDHARDGRRAPAGQPALLARSGQRPADRAGDPAEAFGAEPRRRRVLRPALRRLRQAPRRSREALGRG